MAETGVGIPDVEEKCERTSKQRGNQSRFLLLIVSRAGLCCCSDDPNLPRKWYSLASHLTGNGLHGQILLYEYGRLPTGPSPSRGDHRPVGAIERLALPAHARERWGSGEPRPHCFLDPRLSIENWAVDRVLGATLGG